MKKIKIPPNCHIFPFNCVNYWCKLYEKSHLQTSNRFQKPEWCRSIEIIIIEKGDKNEKKIKTHNIQ